MLCMKKKKKLHAEMMKAFLLYHEKLKVDSSEVGHDANPETHAQRMNPLAAISVI